MCVSSSRRHSSFLTALLAIVAMPAAAQVPVGANPADVAIDPLTNRVYVANLNDDTVTAFDAVTWESVALVTGDAPFELAVDAVRGRVFVAQGAGNVSVIDTSDDSVDPVTVTGVPTAIVVNPATGDAFVGRDNSGPELVRIDGATLTAVQSGAIDGSDSPLLALDWTEVLAVSASAGGQGQSFEDTDLSVSGTYFLTAGTGPLAVDPTTGQVCFSQAADDGIFCDAGPLIETGSDPGAIAIDPVAQRTYVVDRVSNEVTLIASNLSTQTATIGALTGAVAANPTTGQLYVATPGTDAIAVVNGTVVVSSDVGDAPSSIAVNPVINRIFVANAGSDDVSILDAGVLESATVTVGSRPNAAAVDFLTNLIFVTDSSSDNVSVIDGADNSVETVAVGDRPVAVAVDPVGGKAIVANADDDTVTIIVNETLDTRTMTVGDRPTAVAVDAARGTVYVANTDDDSVTVFDDFAPHFASTIAVGDRPVSVAVDSTANRIFVSNEGDDTVSVIDGATLTAQDVPVGDAPFGIAVNPNTGFVYVANSGSDDVTRIDGATLATTTIEVGVGPTAVAIDAVLDRVYVANSLGYTVTMIDGATSLAEDISVGPGPIAIAIDAAANRIFVVRSNGVSVIDGVARLAKSLNADVGSCVGLPLAPAVNPVTRDVYVPGCQGNAVAVISENRQEIPLTVAISGASGPITEATSPELDFAATSSFAPNAPPISGIYYQVDSWMGEWLPATPSGASGSATVALTPGEHVVYAFAIDGHEAASTASSASVSLVGTIASYPIVVTAPEPTATAIAAAAIAALALLERIRA